MARPRDAACSGIEGLLAPIRRRTLPNGLRVNLQPDPTLPLIAVNLCYQAGSRHDPPGRSGLAHFVEHMSFQGSRHIQRGGHLRHAQRVGGTANANTGHDRTNYYQTLPTHCRDLAFWLESDRMGFLLPGIKEDSLERQRRIVVNERRQSVENQPYGCALERLYELLYPQGHPYSRPIIGLSKEIESLTLEDVSGFWKRHYQPANAIISVAGDFSPDRTLEQIERYFGAIPSTGPSPSADGLPEARPGEERDLLNDNVRLGRVFLGYRAPGYGTRGWYAATLLVTALCGGRSSPLSRSLILEREIAMDVIATVQPTQLASTLVLAATVRPGVAVDELEKVLKEELAQAASNLCQEEVERALNRLVTVYYSELQTLEARANMISRWTACCGDPSRMERVPESYQEVSEDDLARIANELWGGGRRSVVTVVPEGGS